MQENGIINWFTTSLLSIYWWHILLWGARLCSSDIEAEKQWLVTGHRNFLLHLCPGVWKHFSTLLSDSSALLTGAWLRSPTLDSSRVLPWKCVLCGAWALCVGGFTYIKVNSHFPLTNADPCCQWVFTGIKWGSWVQLNKACLTASQNYGAIKMLMPTQCSESDGSILEGKNLFCP